MGFTYYLGQAHSFETLDAYWVTYILDAYWEILDACWVNRWFGCWLSDLPSVSLSQVCELEVVDDAPTF